MLVVLSLGGSLIVPNELDVEFLKKFKEAIIDFIRQGNKAIIVCGGGKTCRNYINAAKNISKIKNIELDKLGIKSTELNAELLRVIFGKYSYPNIEPDFKKKNLKFKILVGCGLEPGHSTDYDAVMWAKNYKAEYVVNLTDVDYVYDKSPRKYPDAKPLPKLSWKEMQKIVGNKWSAGAQFPFDPAATKMAAKLKIKIVFLNGKNIDNFKNFLNGKKFIGSVIS